jgi:crotonobetainyl-CoA:carnitine CoA-transferase CaiB-like acyl-CoA transferase
MLSRLRVLDMTDGGAGLCGQILGDLGADVVLIEPPGGAPSRGIGPFADDRPDPGASLAFWSVHRGKRSLVLELASEAGRAELAALAAQADVLVESQPPGALAALGLGHDALLAQNPGLITVSITPFGERGPKAHWPATDLTVTASSMAAFLTGDEDRAPLVCTIPQAFLNAGADAAVGALVALHERARSGRGQHVDVSAQASVMAITQSLVLSHGWGDQQIARSGGGLRVGDVRLRFVYPCKDGFVNFTFLFGPALGPATARMFAWLHEEGFADDALRDKDWVGYGGLIASGVEPLSELARATAALEAFTRSRTKAELYAGAFARRLLLVPLSDAADLAASPQLAARNYWTPLAHPDRAAEVVYPGPFAKLSATPIRYRRPPPRLGEHAAELRAERAAGAPRSAATSPSADTAQAAPPFAELRVLDLSWAYAGPAIGRMLADYGATVVRVESASHVDALRPGQPMKDGVPGFERSANYSNVNVGKLGLGLDFSKPGALEVLRRLARWADVVIENFSPRVMASFGLGYASLRALNPRLVMLSTCLNGQTGPEAPLAGYGTMGASLAGFGFLVGWPDRPPSAPFMAYSDYIAPRFSAAALLAALEHRRSSGEGQHIDVSQAESSMHLIASALLDHQVNGRVQRARGNDADAAPSAIYPCAGEDRWIALAAPDEASWRALCSLAGAPLASDARFATAAQRALHRRALDAAIADWTAPWEVAALEALLISAGVPAHRVATSADCFADPQLAARGHVAWLAHPQLGPVPLETSRLRLSRSSASAAWPGPMLGQHDQEVLAGLLGMSDDEIAELAASGALE